MESATGPSTHSSQGNQPQDNLTPSKPAPSKPAPSNNLASSKPTQGYSVVGLASAIQKAIQSQVNGQLTVKTQSGQQWILSFRVGRLFWASGGEQPFRRWRRLLKQFCKMAPEAVQFREPKMPILWEHWLLNILIKRQKITRQEANELVEHALEEILFDILRASSEVCEIAPLEDAQSISEEPISILSTAEMLNRSQKLLSQWFNLGLMAHSPDGAPKVSHPAALKEQLPPKLSQALGSLATGRASIRELSTITRQPLMTISNLISQGIHKNLIELLPLPDVPNPYAKSQGSQGDRRAQATSQTASNKIAPRKTAPSQATPGKTAAATPLSQEASPIDQGPMVLCVDDSAQVSYILEQILQPAGYRFVGVQDSVGALSAILKNKPDLIFLDLIMPLVYGNEICTQIRRAPAFRNIPIIMLSSNARMLDRLQARGAGATDFMSKPIEAKKVLELLNKHLAFTPGFSAVAPAKPTPTITPLKRQST